MIWLALKTLKHRKAGFAGAFLALLSAAALVCACGMLLETGLRGGVAPQRYAGAPVIVAADQFVRETTVDPGDEPETKAKPLSERAWLSQDLLAQIRGVPGVERVVTEVTFPAYTPSGRLTGHGWESAPLTPYTLAQGRAPEADHEIVVEKDSGLRPGARIVVSSTATPREYEVVGVTEQSLGNVFFSTKEARRLAGRPGMVSAIGVFPQVEVKVDGALTYTGDERGKLEFLDAEKSRVKLISLGASLGGTSLLVAILVVVGTFALSIQQRQRELALLRAVAATPRQVRKLLGGEALMVSAAAGVVGSAAGVGLGFWLRSRFVALGAMPESLQLVVSPFPILAALLATVVAAWAAARVSARRTARIRPVEALGDAALPSSKLPWVRLIAGVLFLAGGVVLTIVLSALSTEAASSPVTMLTALVWTVAAALLGPLLARMAVAALGVPLRLSKVGGYLAARNLRAGAQRLSSVITPLSLMVALTCTILFVQTTMGHAASEQAEAGNRADYVLGPRVSGGTAEAVRSLDGVVAVTEVLRTSVRIGLAKYGAQAVTSTGLEHTLDPQVTEGSFASFGTGSIAVSTTSAERLGVGVGDQVRLTLGDGTPAVLKVAAVYARGLGFGELTLPHELVVQHVDDPLGTLLVAAPTVPRAALAALGLTVMNQAGADAGGSEVNYVAMGLLIAFTSIAVVNTLAMSTADRSREFALLRLVGTTRRQVMGMLRLETLAAVLISVVVGTLISLVTLAAFSLGMTGSALPSVPPLTYLAVIGAAGALALVATVLPARFALRERPAEAIGARE